MSWLYASNKVVDLDWDWDTSDVIFTNGSVLDLDAGSATHLRLVKRRLKNIFEISPALNILKDGLVRRVFAAIYFPACS